MAISISWYLVAKSAVIHLLCRNPTSSLNCLFHFALYNLWLFVHITGIFGDICSGKLEKNTFHNQSADNIPLEPWNYKGFLSLILKTFLFNFSVAIFRFTENFDADSLQGVCKFYNRLCFYNSSTFAGETEKLLTQVLTSSCSHIISCFSKLPLTFLQFNSNHRKFSVLMHLLVKSVKKYMLTWLFHEIKYEGTSSNKTIAANRKEEKYKHTQQHERSVISW